MLYFLEYVDFCAILGQIGEQAAFGFLGSAFEGHGSLPLVNLLYVIPTEFKDEICTDYFEKVHANSHLLRQIIS